MLRRVRDAVKRVEVPLYFVTAGVALYLAAATAFRGAKWPCEAAWKPWTGWFIAALGAALYVPLYALYKALDARFEQQDKRAAERARARTEADRDLDLLCQRVAAQISATCANVHINDLATNIWLCRDDGSFDRRHRFFLPHHRKSSGVVWKRGKGVAGMAWALDRHLPADLRKLQHLREELGDAAFDRLPAVERWGMTAAEVADTRIYTGVIAIRLFSTDPGRGVIAIFVVDYTGKEGFECVVEAAQGGAVGTLLGACEQRLTPQEAA